MDDQFFMQQALELARVPSFTSPNPRVGAVMVRDGAVIATGFHAGAGHPHAEAVALAAADCRGATCYVTLEPCNHHGRTPPCAPALVEAGVTHVVVALRDPDPRVDGSGIAYLEEHGVRVTTGVLERDAEFVNLPFLHHRRTGTPLVTLKLALSLDGRAAAADGSARWISGPAARRRVHERRVEADAVLVGAGTVVADDPSLTVRDVPAGRQPVRVIVDSRGRVPATARVFGPGGDLVMVTTELAPHEVQARWKEAGAEVIVVPSRHGRVDLGAAIASFGDRGWIEILCEGGAELATGLLSAGLVGRLEFFYGPVIVGKGPLIRDFGVATLADAPRFRIAESERLDDDLHVVYVPEAR
ncbi:MAG TPA: bifunctional diaminohydroxyphosphoribosylaminopyrimidine deaminase/5-amino-6-(5-phosphoribosylamino)uracil reductase RibD [Actinomycetota bacterium]|nr:bifunctional diaminohydroxyphosphoribosylaminopyrimidine deaminase/5-amino-6-(5-phosphoribosylamino)uracil reductase RibD [Actinomycetota bacterium]